MVNIWWCSKWTHFESIVLLALGILFVFCAEAKIFCVFSLIPYLAAMGAAMVKNALEAVMGDETDR